MRVRAVAALFCALTAAPAAQASELRLARPIGDGMVIQRDAVVPIRGWANEGAEVVVGFDGRSHRTRADRTGRWRIELPPQDAGGPWEMTVASAGEELRIRDVLCRYDSRLDPDKCPHGQERCRGQCSEQRQFFGVKGRDIFTGTGENS